MVDGLALGMAARAVGGRDGVGGRRGAPASGRRLTPAAALDPRSCVGSWPRAWRSAGVGGAQVAEDVLEAVVAEHRALEAGRADVDAEQVEQVVGADGRDLGQRLALDLVGQQARRWPG